MCTLAVALHAHPDHPLLVTSVRDEFHARPARGPLALPGAPRAIGGVDLEKGGSWTGVTTEGLFVGLTNQRPDGPIPDGLRSRGELVVAALASGARAAAARVVTAIDPQEFPSFNLLVADADGAFVLYARRSPGSLELVELPAGLHVLANDRLGAASMPKTRRAEERLRTVLPLRGEPLLQALQGVLADHEPPAALPEPPPGAPYDAAFARRLQALCVHTEPYGTRSALVAALAPGRVQALRWSDGAPCVTPFLDVRARLPA